jgi:hypothetical protein
LRIDAREVPVIDVSDVPTPAPQIVILIPSDDAQSAATAILHMLQVATWTMQVRVIAYGPDKEAVRTVAFALHADPHQLLPFVCDGDRWDAVNAGLQAAPLPDGCDVVLLSDDARPPLGWEQDLTAALEPRALAVGADLALPPPPGTVGIVVPVSEQARSAAQRITLAAEDLAGGVDAYAARRRELYAGMVAPLDVPDDLAVLFRRSLVDLMLPGGLFRSRLGRWTLADLVLRAEMGGTCAVVAEGAYVARSRLVPPRSSPEWRDIDCRLRFYHFHCSSDPVRVVTAVRVRLGSLRDLHLLRGVVGRAAQVTDGIAILLVSNPLEMLDDPELKNALRGTVPSPMLTTGDQRLLVACDHATSDVVAREFEAWATAQLARRVPVRVGVWTSTRDDAGERTMLRSIALDSREIGGSVWVLALDQAELIEEGMTHEFVHRLATHPNPTIRAYDLPTLTLWDAPRLAREDAPFGDGGTWKGGPSSARMYRAFPMRPFPVFEGGARSTHAPPCSDDAIRVASVRLRNAALVRPVDRDRRGLTSPEEGMRLSALRQSQRIGLHMLVYERENPEDVARWLDEVHGLVDAIVLVWTGATHPPSTDPDCTAWANGMRPVFADIANRHGGFVVDHPLADDLAAARNAGLDALAERGIAWALFVDPDEWFRDPIGDARAVRRMAESTRAGWLFQVANYTTKGTPSVSDSVRMSSLTVDGLRMSGRVHESFGDRLNALQRAGVDVRLGYAPFVLQHRGMALGAERTAEKLAHYERLLRLELVDRPHNPGAWVSLAWHYDNEGRGDLAEECLRRAVECAGHAYLPFRELGIARLREARDLFAACVDRLAPVHPYARQAEKTLAWLRENAPDPLRPGPLLEGGIPDALPEFPPVPRYDLRKEGV